jgi:hypothetical protein
MIPADQCLDADDAPVAQVGDRLVGEGKLLFEQRLPQLALDRQLLLAVDLHRCIEGAGASAAGCLGSACRGLGARQQLIDAAWRALLLGLRCCRSLAQRPSHKGGREQHCKHKHSNQHCDQNPKPQFVVLTWLVVHCHMDAANQIPTFTFQLGA